MIHQEVYAVILGRDWIRIAFGDALQDFIGRALCGLPLFG